MKSHFYQTRKLTQLTTKFDANRLWANYMQKPVSSQLAKRSFALPEVQIEVKYI